MGTRLNLNEINRQMDMDKLKKENPSLYKSIKEKNKNFNKDVRK